MLAGAVHELPLKVSAFPWLSTAAQNEDVGQETDVRFSVPSMLAGVVHELPLKVTAFPWLSTAMQNEADGHDTASRRVVSMLVEALQELPL